MFPMSADTAPVGPTSLGGYLGVLRRRKFLALAVVIAVVGLGVAYTLRQPPVYSSSVTLAVRTPLDASRLDENSYTDPNRALRNEIEFITSDLMDTEVAKALSEQASIRVAASDDSDIITITATADDPELTAATANEYAASYKRLRISEVLASNSESAAEIEKLLADVTDQITQITEPIAVLDFQIAGTPPGPDLEALERQRSALASASQRSLEALVSQQASYRTQLASLGMRSEAIRAEGIRTLQDAAVPGEPIGPSLFNNVILAGVLGTLLAVGAVLLAEYFDDTIKSKDSLEPIVAPVIGMIPAVVGWKAKDPPRVIAIEQPASSEAEAYRALRTSVKFLGIQQSLRILQVTSPMAGEGKSSTVANLAVVLARAGDRVLVISGDLRRPRIESFLGADARVGLTSVLLGDVAVADAIQPVEEVPGLYVLATGELPPNPSELLAWQRTEELIKKLAEQFTMVIIDSPPVVPVTDALVTARFCDATVVVARAGQTSRRRLHQCVQSLRLVEANILGSVLNDAQSRDDYLADGYHYYGTDKSARPTPRPSKKREAVDPAPAVKA